MSSGVFSVPAFTGFSPSDLFVPGLVCGGYFVGGTDKNSGEYWACCWSVRDVLTEPGLLEFSFSVARNLGPGGACGNVCRVQ